MRAKFLEDLSAGDTFVSAARTITESDVVAFAGLTGQLDRTGLFSGSAIAILGIRNWQFCAPLFIDDTVKFRPTIVDVRRISSGDRGVVQRYVELLNQRDEVVQTGHIDIMVRARTGVAV